MVATSFLISVGSYLLEKTGDLIFNQLGKKITQTELDQKFKIALTNATAIIQNRYPEALGGSLDFFFKDKQLLEELLKLLFRKSIINHSVIEEKFDLQTLPPNFLSEFVTTLKDELLKDHVFDLILSNNEIYFMIIGIDSNLNKIAHSTELSLNELKKIRETIQEKIADNFSYDNFFENYKKIALNNFNEVNYIGLGLSPDIRRGMKKLNDIYVKPEFTLKNYSVSTEEDNFLEREMRNTTIDFKDIFTSSSKNIVILGDPGAGKSVLIKYIICCLLEGNTNEFEYSESLNGLPIRIELRKYLSQKKSSSTNFTQYISYLLEKEFSVVNFSEVQLKRILDTQLTLIFFDGLDEIFNEDEKYDVKKDIENFLITYPMSKAIVTSRYIGYEEVKLDSDIFIELSMKEFNDTQIKEYATKWYQCEAVRDEVAKQEIQSFLELKEDIDEELIANPLLLSLIMILYRNNGRLPHSKLEIYRSCTRTLVEKWDEVKKLEIDIKVKNRKDSIFANLAFWQYESLSRNKDNVGNGNITYTLVKDEVSRIIQNKLKLTDDAFESSRWADEFLEYAKNRSLYFDNNFTHKTFLEYYTAFWIYQNSDLKGDFTQRNQIINQYIGNPYWHIVIELLINLIDENQPDTDIIDNILTENISNNNDAYLFFLAIVHKLKNVNESLIYDLVKKSIEICLYSLWDKPITSKLFRRLTSIVNHDKYRYMIEKILGEIISNESSNDKLLLNISLFQVEMNLFTQRDIQINSITLNADLYENDKFLYLFYNDITKLDTIIGFIKIFGVDAIKTPSVSKYGGVHLFKTLNYFFENITTSSKIDEKIVEIVTLIENGIDLDTIKKELYLVGDKAKLLEDKNIDLILSNIKKIESKLDYISA
ncbi:NACHT domain-containing protein [Paenibacillus radicis (ex Gao et al. 2016)]|uniref:NACHT domain-containing protein n=1 Tax=Paenibacillus radicis (ex Gao et al. 2016) TaxID=1737354 RepID=A0A917LYR4_9BACL|nr:NACHT domain-containing protein [Paenibacillus radicis (ex Gao et al. 2016)]GGG65905.1 hypothetical protein GCM10010918_20300 [Paenibacillus radicis (ex Gao et al. 2016)]